MSAPDSKEASLNGSHDSTATLKKRHNSERSESRHRKSLKSSHKSAKDDSGKALEAEKDVETKRFVCVLPALCPPSALYFMDYIFLIFILFYFL